jgi:hypothetical protein
MRLADRIIGPAPCSRQARRRRRTCAAAPVLYTQDSKDRHQRIVDLLHLVLGVFVLRGNGGLVRLGPFEVRLTPTGPSREPDLFFVSNDHLDRLSEDRFYGGPDLVVEVVSDDSVTRDHGEKLREYEAAGVREYWIIAPRPRRRSSQFYRLDSGGHYHQVGPDTAGIVRSEVIPGFWWRVSWFWEVPMPVATELLNLIVAGEPEA